MTSNIFNLLFALVLFSRFVSSKNSVGMLVGIVSPPLEIEMKFSSSLDLHI